MNLNLNPFDVDFAEPAVTFIKSCTLLMAGTALEGVEPVHLPPIVIECAKVLAYLGASVAFFKFILVLIMGNNVSNEK